MRFLENKIPPPVLLVIALATEFWLAHFTLRVAPTALMQRFSAAAIVVIALSILATAMLTFRRAGTTIDPIKIDKAATIVNTGIFGRTRNPMYVALVLVASAGVVYFGSWLLIIVPLALAAYLWRFQILPEERMLAAKFGNAYLDYTRAVRRWF